MRLLLDTHVIIWWAAGKSLAPRAAAAIESSSNEIAISVASIWEAEIKAASRRLHLKLDLAAEARSHGLPSIAIEAEHALVAARLPAHHRDPFDRMLVAQAQVESLTLVTRDPVFGAYDVPVLAA